MHRYLVFSVVGLALFLKEINNTAMAVAFPVIVNYFDTSLVLAGWVLSVYSLVTISTMPITARLSDNFGRRYTLQICMLLFTVGSLLAALAPSIEWLIFFRVIQGLGGGGVITSATGIVSDEFPDMRQRVIGLFSTIIPFGAVVGPNVGAWLVESLGWQSLFWINVPFGLGIMVLTHLLISPDKKRATSKDLDIVGSGLILGSVSALMVSLTLLGKGYNVPAVFIFLVAALGVICVWLFIRHSQRASDAVIDLQLLTGRPFLATNLFNIAYGAGTMGLMSFLPLYAISVYGMSVLQTGLTLTPRSVAMMIVATITAFSLTRWGYRWPILLGTTALAFSFAALSLEPAGFDLAGVSLTPLGFILVMSLVSGIGFGLAAPAANNACIELRPEQVASITGLRSLFRQTGGALGVVIGTLVLESSSSMARGFTVLFIGFAVVLVISLPAVFAMPRSPTPPAH